MRTLSSTSHRRWHRTSKHSDDGPAVVRRRDAPNNPDWVIRLLSKPKLTQLTNKKVTHRVAFFIDQEQVGFDETPHFLTSLRKG